MDAESSSRAHMGTSETDLNDILAVSPAASGTSSIGDESGRDSNIDTDGSVPRDTIFDEDDISVGEDSDDDSIERQLREAARLGVGLSDLRAPGGGEGGPKLAPHGKPPKTPGKPAASARKRVLPSVSAAGPEESSSASAKISGGGSSGNTPDSDNTVTEDDILVRQGYHRQANDGQYSRRRNHEEGLTIGKEDEMPAAADSSPSFKIQADGQSQPASSPTSPPLSPRSMRPGRVGLGVVRPVMNEEAFSSSSSSSEGSDEEEDDFEDTSGENSSSGGYPPSDEEKGNRGEATATGKGNGKDRSAGAKATPGDDFLSRARESVLDEVDEQIGWSHSHDLNDKDDGDDSSSGDDESAVRAVVAEAEMAASPTRRQSVGRGDGDSERGHHLQENQHRSEVSRGDAVGVAETGDASDPPPPPPPRSVKIRVGAGKGTDSNAGTMNRGDKGRSNFASESSAAREAAAKTLASASSSSKPLQPRVSTSMPIDPEDLDAGVLPDMLMTMREKIESMTLFDSDMMRLAGPGAGGTGTIGLGVDPSSGYDDDDERESKESLRRSFQQSISAAVLVSLAHKRYERRRLAAMEIEKAVRSLVQQGELDRVRAILLLLSDDYVRSTSEDARKGGVVALAASAIGLKKADDSRPGVNECRDLILASVVHACQDHSTRVRYYATESLFNVVKVIPALAVQHFFILFEILRSLYADVDVDVRSGAELLDKKLKEVIVGAINAGQFAADACVPLFARFIHMRNKPTKRLTLTWLHEFTEKLIGAPILEFLHLFLGGIFAMVSDPNASVRELSLGFLQSALPKLLETNDDFEDANSASFARVDFDKILQSLVTTMEHPDPFVRKVAMYWMSRIVETHMPIDDVESNDGCSRGDEVGADGNTEASNERRRVRGRPLSAASVSVRNSLPHVLPGILLSIGDTFHMRSNAQKDSFLPDHTTHSLAERTNARLQDAVRLDGKAYVSHLDGFVVALREELDSPGGLGGRYPPAVERKPYRMDVKADGTGIESTGWFRSNVDGFTSDDRDDALMMSRLCALQWIVVLYEYVNPNALKAKYASEFINPIVHQLVDDPPEVIVFKSFEVLAKITVPVDGENAESEHNNLTSSTEADSDLPTNYKSSSSWSQPSLTQPMSDDHARFALGLLDESRRKCQSRDREVFSALIRLHSKHHRLLSDRLSRVIEFMCTLQPPEFIYVSFALELDRFVEDRAKRRERHLVTLGSATAAPAGADVGVVPTEAPAVVKGQEDKAKKINGDFSRELQFVSSFVQHLNDVLLNSREAAQLRDVLKDSVGQMSSERGGSLGDKRRSHLFHVLLHSFSHNLAAALSLCLWGGAFLTASSFLRRHVDPLDTDLNFYLEVDELIELLERPLFRHLHLLMLECDTDPRREGSGAMLFRALKSILMLMPQSTGYNVLKDRLTTVARFRQSAVCVLTAGNVTRPLANADTEAFVARMHHVRSLHCESKWRTIRAESLAYDPYEKSTTVDVKKGRREWLGYANDEEEKASRDRHQLEKQRLRSDSERRRTEGAKTISYEEFGGTEIDNVKACPSDERHSIRIPDEEEKTEASPGKEGGSDNGWKGYWEGST
mmetsp:Transcript_21161/g.61543  ORF Transcript_21161/g.61543 Transcript_21161/m.61543 type:complete len:1588 (-) Transcript_21161:127-4890(-)